MQSEVDADLEPVEPGRSGPTGLDSCLQRVQLEVGPFVRSAPDRTLEHRRDGNFVRLGLTEVQGIGRELAKRIVLERQQAGSPTSTTWYAGPGSRWRRPKPWLRLELSTASDCLVARRSGTLDTPTTTNPARLGHRRHSARAARHERGRIDSGRSVGRGSLRMIIRCSIYVRCSMITTWCRSIV